MKHSYLTITDQFCGAGGSSQGARRLSHKMGGGFEITLATNTIKHVEWAWKRLIKI